MKEMCIKITVLLLAGSAMLVHAEPNVERRMRVFAKLPNWSGIWEQYAVDISGRGILGTDSGLGDVLFKYEPPYKQEWSANLQAYDPTTKLCTWGYPGLMVGSPLMFQALVTPEETALIFNFRETRHIYTDGRRHPSADELWPTPWGHSVGRWEGKTLVIETIATSSPLIFGDPQKGWRLGTFSSQARFTERLRMVDHDTLEDEITIEDPIALTHAWRFTRQYHRVSNLSYMTDEDCTGNDRTRVVDGRMEIAPP